MIGLKHLFSLFLIVLSVNLYAQKVPGVPYIQNFPPSEYHGGSVCWEISQNSDGRILAGMSGAFLSFDGKTFEKGAVNNGSTVRSVDSDQNGRTYVGAKGEFGFVERDSLDQLVYTNLSDQLPDSVRDFNDVWNTYVTDDGAFFLTWSRVFQYKDGEVTCYNIPEQLNAHLGFTVNGKLYVAVRTKGLCVFDGYGFSLVKGGENLVLRTYGIVPKDDGLLILTRAQGLIYLDTITGDTSHFTTELDDKIISGSAYHMSLTRNGLVAVATIRDGLYLINPDGSCYSHLTTANGLPSDNIKYVISDQQGDLWLATAYGISHVELSLPLRAFSADQGLQGIVRSISSLNDTLWIGTETNLYRFDPSVGISGSFIGQSDDILTTWDVTNYGRWLIGATSDGLLIRKPNGTLDQIPGPTIFNLIISKRYRNQIYMLMKDGLKIARIDTSSGELVVSKIKELPNFHEEMHYGVEIESGDIISVGGQQYAIRIDAQSLNLANEDTVTNLVRIAEGKPIKDVIPFRYRGMIYFNATDSLMQVDPKTGIIKLVSGLPINITNGNEHAEITSVRKTSDGTYWFRVISRFKDSYLRAEQTDTDEVRLHFSALSRLGEKVDNAPHFYEDSNGVIWIGGNNGAVRFNPHETFSPDSGFALRIYDLMLNEDSVLTSGFPLNKIDSSLVLPYEFGKISLKFNAVRFNNPKDIEYQYKLDGYEDEWSNWSKKNEALYTNLSEGEYTLRVRARDVYGLLSVERKLYFVVRPPWYRTGVAYVCFILAGLLLFYFWNRISTARLLRSKRELELKVQERTREIQKEKELVEEKNEEIVAQKEIIEEVNAEVTAINKDITASIRYAQKIQSAVLPSPEKLKNWLPESFIWFRPRDIVSGDFYWFDRIGNVVVLAAADCTGHGVPGAFMSMICSTLIEKVVKDNQVGAPHEALRKVDEEVVRALSNDTGKNEADSEFRDGMDVAVIAIHLDTMLMQYSGAHRPLYLMRDGELLVYKGSRYSVGGRMGQEKIFEGGEIQLQKGDSIYLFSDGFPDQFGGSDSKHGKKFMIRRFKDMIRKMVDLPMAEQEAILQKTFEEWRGDFEQTDDMLVVGIKI